MLRETITVPSRLTTRLGATASTAVVGTGCAARPGGGVTVGAGSAGAGTGSVATAGAVSVLTVSTVGAGCAGAGLVVLAASWGCAGAVNFSSISAATKANALPGASISIQLSVVRICFTGVPRSIRPMMLNLSPGPARRLSRLMLTVLLVVSM